MPSPVFQDVFYFGASGSKKVEVGVESSPSVKLPIDFSANAIRTFIGILEGRKIRDIVYSNGTDEINLDCPASLADTLALGDKYDVPFFRELWKLAIRVLAENGGEHALMAFSAAYSVGDGPLAKAALKHCKGISNPLRFSECEVEKMGWKSWLRIVRAWDHASMYDGHKNSLVCFSKQSSWQRLGDYYIVEEEVNTKALQNRN